MHLHRRPSSARSGSARRARLAGIAMVGVLAVAAAACGSNSDGTNDTGVPADTVDMITGPKPTTEGSGPLGSYEVEPSGSGNSVLGDPFDPSTNDTLTIEPQGP